MAEANEGFNEALLSLTGLLELPAGAFQAMADLAARVVPGCDGASVSVLEADGAVTTAAASDERTMQLDDLQYDNDEGPCLSAIHTATVVQVDDFSHDSRYPNFAPAAAALGVSSCLSVPLTASAQTVGGLNLYGETSHAYDDAGTATGGQVAVQASVLVAIRRAHQQSLNLADTLHATIASGAVIEQAKGIVMAESHCDAGHAFDILRRASQRQNVKLRDIAQTIVAGTSRQSRGPTDTGVP